MLAGEPKTKQDKGGWAFLESEPCRSSSRANSLVSQCCCLGAWETLGAPLVGGRPAQR